MSSTPHLPHLPVGTFVDPMGAEICGQEKSGATGQWWQTCVFSSSLRNVHLLWHKSRPPTPLEQGHPEWTGDGNHSPLTLR